MSRFTEKYYLAVLDHPPAGRSYLASSWEKPLWQRWNRPRQLCMAAVFFVLASVPLVAAFLAIDNRFLSGTTAFLLSVSAIVVLAAFCIGYVFYARALKAKCSAIREAVSFEQFWNASASLQSFDMASVRDFRQVLGFVYNVPAEKIYCQDNGDSLAMLSPLQQPFALEVVLGLARKLEVHLDDSEVDRIVSKLRARATTVEDLGTLLISELVKKTRDKDQLPRED